MTARNPTPRRLAATACRSAASSVITLEINARFSRAHSLTPSAEGNSAAAARSIRSGSDLMECLGINVLYESRAGVHRSADRIDEGTEGREGQFKSAARRRTCHAQNHRHDVPRDRGDEG